MSSPLVSICVPVYNAAPYIARCVRSLMEQDYRNIEYVFVDDGSEDDSVNRLEEVVRDYSQRKAMVKIYHNDSNRGSAYTRRVLAEKAQGEYITYVDADDRVDTDFISKLTAEAVANEADVVIAPMREYSGDHATEIRDEFVYENFFENCLHDFVCHLCGKLIRRELVVKHACYAPDGMNYLEDRLALLQIAYYTSKVSQTDQVYYHYIHHSNSITAKKTDYHFDCLIRYWQEAERLMRKWGVWEHYAEACHKMQVENKTALMLNCYSMEIRKKYADLYRENELASLRGLLPGFKLMGLLIHSHAWGLISVYQRYIDWLIQRKNKQNVSKNAQ